MDVLYEPMFWDRNGEESPGEEPYFVWLAAHSFTSVDASLRGGIRPPGLRQ